MEEMVLTISKDKSNAPSEAQTHGLQIMRLTRCQLRYRGLVMIKITL